jgi:hypothetical protein
MKVWRCGEVGITCVCADTADEGDPGGSCPSANTCCSLDKKPNSDGVRTCVCLPGGGSCERSGDVSAVDRCPP